MAATSSLSVTAIAAGLKRPRRFAGYRFFNPVPLMKVVEVVAGLKTDSEVCAQLAAYAYALGCDYACVWHFTPSGVRLHWIELAAGWRVFRAAYTLIQELPALERRAQHTKLHQLQHAPA